MRCKPLHPIENSLTQGFWQQKRAAVSTSSRKRRYASAINTPPSDRSSFEGSQLLRRGVLMKERYFGYCPRDPRQFGRLARYKTKCLAFEQPIFAGELNRFEGIDLGCRTFTF